MEEHKIRFKKFDGRDYSFWKARVVNGLMFLGLDSYLTVKAETSDAAKVVLDNKALSFVKDSLSDNLFRKYMTETNTKDLWSKIQADYNVVDAQLLFVKRNKFLFCKKARHESMEAYLNRLTSLKQDLADAGSQVNDSDFILMSFFIQ